MKNPLPSFKSLIGLFISFLIAGSSFAQENENIKGLLVDETRQPIPYATIIAKNSIDSTFYKGEITNESGHFSFTNVKAGNYFLEIQCTGMEKKIIENIVISEATTLIDLDTVQLKSVSAELNEAVVVADKPFIERKADRVVVNIENSIVNVGTTAADMLEKLPGVLVDQNGNISLKGKSGIIIMIDNKPVYASGNELMNMLRGISSNNVQRVEIISNPPAKYDASGNAGIINIITIRNRKEGWNGNFNASYGQGRYEKYNSGISIGTRNKKVNFYSSYNFSHRKNYNDIKILRKYINGDTIAQQLNTDNYLSFPMNSNSIRANCDISLSDKTTLSFLAGTGTTSMDITTKSSTSIYNGDLQNTGDYGFVNKTDGVYNNYYFNTELKKRLDSLGSEISFNADYGRYWNSNIQEIYTTVNDENDNIVSVVNNISDQNRNVNFYAFKMDYSKPFKKLRFDAGVKSSFVVTDNDSKFYDTNTVNAPIDSTRSNHFLYQENINAGYLNLNKNGDKFSWQFGLRAEHTYATGEQIFNSTSFKRNYIQLFPSVYFDYKINEKNSLNINLGRRIDRPAYEQMNPYRLVVDATFFKDGNPYLYPTLNYVSELTYTRKNELFITFGYTYSSNSIADVIVRDGNSNASLQTVVNIDKMHYYNFNVTYTKKINSWWTTNNSLFSYYALYSSQVTTNFVSGTTPFVYLSSIHSFKLPKNFSAECNFNYTHKFFYGISTYLPSWSLNLGMKKTILKDRGILTFNATDLLYKSYTRLSTDVSNLNENWTVRRETRVYMLSFIYQFGKGQARARRTTGSDDEKKRIGM